MSTCAPTVEALESASPSLEQRELGLQAALAASNNALHNGGGGPISESILDAAKLTAAVFRVRSTEEPRSTEAVAADVDAGPEPDAPLATDAISAMSI